MKLRIALCIVIAALMLGIAPTALAQDEGTKSDKATYERLKETLVTFTDEIGHDGNAAVAFLADQTLSANYGTTDRVQVAQLLSNAFPVDVYSVFNARTYSDGRYSIDFTSTGLFTPYGLQSRRWFLASADNGGFQFLPGGDLILLKLPGKLHQVPMTASFQLDSVTMNPASVSYADGDVVTIALENTQPQGTYGIAVYLGDELINRLGVAPGDKDMMGLVNLKTGTYSVYLTQWVDNGPANVMFDIATSFTVQ